MPRSMLASSQRELAYPGDLKTGDQGPQVKRLQEWLIFHKALTGGADGVYGSGTANAVSTFQKAQALAQIGAFDEPTWDILIAPLRKADAFGSKSPNAHDAVVETAQAHLAQGPNEIGGQNCGPWVRYYTHGGEGEKWEWCQGFASSMFQLAFETVDRATPFPTTIVEKGVGIWCLYVPTFVDSVKAHKAFVSGADPKVASKIHPGAFFFVRGGDAGYAHVGLVETIAADGRTFSTVEGNWGDKVSRTTRTVGPEFDFGVFAA